MVFSGIMRRIGDMASSFVKASRPGKPYRRDPYDISSFPEAEPMRRRVDAMFRPVVDLLNETVEPDDEGRRFHLITNASLLLGNDPAVYVTIGRLDDRELEAMQFFCGEEGRDRAVSPGGLRFTDLCARSYDFHVPVMESQRKMLFVAYAPVAPDAYEFTKGTNHYTSTRFTRTDLSRVYQGMMHDLGLAEASRFVFVDWKDLKQAVETRLGHAKIAIPAPRPPRFIKG